MKETAFSKRTSRYLSYVLRCWQVQAEQDGIENQVWRFSLHDPRTDQRRGFATFEAMMV